MILHATSVAFGDRALLLTGASGRGKSTLALQLMGLGATLVADDRTLLTHADGQIRASCPPTIAGMIEARGVGLLNAPYLPDAAVALVVDLDQTEPERLPPLRHITMMGCELALVFAVDAPHFPISLKHYVCHGRRA